MTRTLVELTAPAELYKTYEIYKDCMFLPTEEKFRGKIDAFLADDAVKLFACRQDGELVGVTVLFFPERNKGEIIGIATERMLRKTGIGRYMVETLIQRFGLRSVLAETDEDAVGFYRKLGFGVTKFTECFGGESAIRYRCVL